MLWNMVTCCEGGSIVMLCFWHVMLLGYFVRGLHEVSAMLLLLLIMHMQCDKVGYICVLHMWRD